MDDSNLPQRWVGFRNWSDYVRINNLKRSSFRVEHGRVWGENASPYKMIFHFHDCWERFLSQSGSFNCLGTPKKNMGLFFFGFWQDGLGKRFAFLKQNGSNLAVLHVGELYDFTSLDRNDLWWDDRLDFGATCPGNESISPLKKGSWEDEKTLFHSWEMFVSIYIYITVIYIPLHRILSEWRFFFKGLPSVDSPKKRLPMQQMRSFATSTSLEIAVRNGSKC